MSQKDALKSDFNCNKCKTADNDRMVQCDKCDKWYHYDCVSVNSGVADVSWSCEGCNTGTNNETACGSNAASITNNQSVANLGDQLRQPQATSSPTNTGEVLQMASMIAEEIGGRSFPSASVSVSRATNATYHTQANNQGKVVYSTGGSENAKPSTTSASSTLSFPFNTNQPKTIPMQQNERFNSQIDLQLKMLEEQQRLQQEFLERKYQILSQLGQNEQTQHNLCNVTSSLNFFSGPQDGLFPVNYHILMEILRNGRSLLAHLKIVHR